MPMKLKKLRETATLEAGATIPRSFSYKTAFFVFVACLLGFGGLVFLVVHLMTMNQITTPRAEAVPSVELDVIAQGRGKITSMKVSYGDTVQEGQVLFEVEPLEDSAYKARLDQLWADVMVAFNDVGRKYNDALAKRDVAQAEVDAEKKILESKKKEVSLFNRGKERELKEAELRRDRAAAYFAVAEGNYKNAEEYYKGESRLITLDKYLAAKEKFEIRKLEFDFAGKQVVLYQQAVEDSEAEGNARVEAQQEQINKAQSILKVRNSELVTIKKEFDESLKVIENYRNPTAAETTGEVDTAAAAAAEMEGSRVKSALLVLKHFKREKGFGVYHAPFTGKVGWIQRKEGDAIGPGDFVMKLFKPDGMEIHARFGQDSVGRLAKGQKVDVKLRTEDGNVHLEGRVEAITNQFYILRPDVRDRVRIENPTAEMNVILVRISLKGEKKEVLYPGDPVTVTIYTTD